MKTAQERKSLKKCEREIMIYRMDVTTLKNQDGNAVRWKNVCRPFFKSRAVGSEEEKVLPILMSEVERALKLMKKGKERMVVPSEMLLARSEQLWNILALCILRIERYKGEESKPYQWKE